MKAITFFELGNRIPKNVISRYSDADIFRFSDGWWITTYSKEQKRFIKLVGSFKTKDEARAEIRSLNGL